MAHAAHNRLPGWFPFALIASGVIAIGAGIRSGWKLPADQRPPTPPPPNPQSPVQAGVLHDWAEGCVRGPHGGGGGHGGGGHGGGGHGHGGGHGGHGRPVVVRGGGFRGGGGWWGGGPWWDTWVPSGVATETCTTWGDPVAMPAAMQTSVRAALSTSSGRPITARGPDGVLYLFALENGAATARPCATTAVA